MGQFIVGIDISKAYFDVYLVGGIESASGRFDNKIGDFRKFGKWLKKRKVGTLHAWAAMVMNWLSGSCGGYLSHPCKF